MVKAQTFCQIINPEIDFDNKTILQKVDSQLLTGIKNLNQDLNQVSVGNWFWNHHLNKVWNIRKNWEIYLQIVFHLEIWMKKRVLTILKRKNNLNNFQISKYFQVWMLLIIDKTQMKTTVWETK